ncbi:putative Choline ethanolamine kinase Phosphotransferase enzyme family [Trypanosoma vivax]|uniref:ethanolamine kinase n=1 Tax=Trypanosoma vivax (strain Y486) TaxID=1055687 RepID=G0UA93_TRYVY|nr:putative choline/ethanolamine kinase [Trypanosoma vivax]KAH8617933.1 putative Choline ethanolamine kinase Phosphotransferase enzyme family [Trypanosoma vivax]CCC52725.1 putative choline/ethanolamine kinase [Trypanosoma vivax Y486]
MVSRNIPYVHCSAPVGGEGRHTAFASIVLKCCSHILFPENGPCTVGEVDAASSVDPSLLRVDHISGGITNELFHVYNPSDRPHSVVLRVFGNETQRFVSRQSELFYQSFFVPTYAHGDNFLIYQYLDQYKALEPKEMAGEYANIACEVASFHVRATLEARADFVASVPDTDGKRGREDVAGELKRSRFDREENYTIHTLTQWAGQLMSDDIFSKVKEENRGTFELVARQLVEEAAWVIKVLKENEADLGESTCHNDLLSGNIMRHTASGSLMFIDFEYTMRNYFLFDIANLFNEYAGFDCDYDTFFPSDEHMEKFIVVYLQALREEVSRCSQEARSRGLNEIIPEEERFFMVMSGRCNDGDSVGSMKSCDSEGDKQLRVKRMVRLTKFLTLASHLTWSIWALLQEAVSVLDVNFLQYSQLRLQRYLSTKESFSL